MSIKEAGWDTHATSRVSVSVGSLILFSAFLVHFYFYPSIVDRADAWAYQQYGISFREHGLLSNFGTFRTYGYPFFIYLLTYPFGINPHGLALATSVVQYLVFFVGTKALGRAVHQTDPLLGAAVTIGLLLNPFVISLVTDNLTEGLSVGIYIWLVYIVVVLGRTKLIYAFASLVSLGWLLATLSVEIRPANISILAGWCMAIVWLSYITYRNDEMWRKKLAIVALTSSLAILPLLPQMLYNFSNYQTLSPMPVCSLGEFQLQYGILAMKYDTVVHGGSAAGYNYPNPLFQGSIRDGWSWYTSHPLAGVGTILLHIFNALSVTSILTYIRSESPVSRIITHAAYSAVYIAGGYQIFISKSSLLRRAMSRSWSDQPTIGYLVTSQFLTLMICAVSAIELRFGVFACGLLSVSAVMLMLKVAKRSELIGRNLSIFFTLAVMLSVLASYFIDSVGSERPLAQQLNFDFSAHRCVM